MVFKYFVEIQFGQTPYYYVDNDFPSKFSKPEVGAEQPDGEVTEAAVEAVEAAPENEAAPAPVPEDGAEKNPEDKTNGNPKELKKVKYKSHKKILSPL